MAGEQQRVAARRQLGAELRSLREQRGLSGQQLAASLGWSQSKISRIEGARTRSERSDVEAVLAALDVPSALRVDLLTLAEEAAGPPEAWRNSTRVGLTRRQQDFVNSEAAAVRIRHYQPLIIPGYLQTPAYARRVLELAGSRDVDRAVAMRMARGAVVVGDPAPKYEIVLMETSLRWRPFATDLMAEQLDVLAQVARRKNVDLRVISLDVEQTAYVQHPFVVYDFEAAPSEVIVEATHADTRLTDADDVRSYVDCFDRLARTALSPTLSMRLIRFVAQEMHAHPTSAEGR